MPTLYVVATPIGNLEDVSLRALRVLRQVGLIAAEDTRKARRLLGRYRIKTPATSFHAHTRPGKLERILRVLEGGADVAVVSEAGMPGISDPGAELVRAAIARGYRVVPVPGPSALTAALAAAGLPASRFTFLGFLPGRTGERRQALARVATDPATLVAYEAPHRLVASLRDILAVLGDRRLAVCRELTKLYEEVFRGTVSEAIAHFGQPRGEFTLVIEGWIGVARAGVTPEVEAQLAEMRRAGRPAREVVGRLAAESGIPRRQLYRAWLRQARAEEKTGETGVHIAR